jgi:hypothetical protein
MGLNDHAGYRGFFRQVSGLFFGKVHSTGAFKTPVRAAKALCGTVWQLLYIRANDKDGRQYTIIVSAQDEAGNVGSAVTHVMVPHDQGGS